MGKKRPKRAYKLNWKVVFAWFPFLAFFHTMRRPTLLSPCLKQFSDFVGHSVLYTLVKFYTTTLALASLCQHFHFTFSAVLEGTEYIWHFCQIQTNDVFMHLFYHQWSSTIFHFPFKFLRQTNPTSVLHKGGFTLQTAPVLSPSDQYLSSVFFNISKCHFFSLL